MQNKKFAGFWIRALATLIDTIILVVIFGVVSGLDNSWSSGFWNLLIKYAVPFIVTIWFWRKFKATPGKMILKLEVVDATTGNQLSIKQAIGRYFGYIPATLCLGLGIIWVIIDKKNQGWHDKWANTVVICNKNPKEKVVFHKE